MDLKDAQRLADQIGGVVFVEEGQIRSVLLSYDTYSRLFGQRLKQSTEANSAAPHTLSRQHISDYETDTLNKEIMALQEDVERKEQTLFPGGREV